MYVCLYGCCACAVLRLSVSEVLQRISALPGQLSSPSAASSDRLTSMDCWLVLATPSVQRALLTSIFACLSEVVEREAVPSVRTHNDTRSVADCDCHLFNTSPPLFSHAAVISVLGRITLTCVR